SAKIVSKNANKSAIDIGDKVTIKTEDGPETYEIVGSNESDPASGKISSESPIAKALYGHKVGDQVEIPIPDGKMSCKVLKVN
ncbi:MAG: GreA/GreB family elongation factor, partial [Patescibacteria group bacterium]|nr:GreA/GreB family elongation factor [Patescibacteria group bacterium]